MRTMTYLDAIVEAQREEMKRDEKTFIMGLDVSWSILGTTGNEKSGLLAKQFGLDRVRDAPLSENGYVGAGAGAAMVGMRPIIEIEMAPFLYVAMDQLTSIIAKSTYLYGGQATLPLTVRLPMLYQVANAAQHSDRPYNTMATIPGFKIVTPSTPRDMYGLLKTAIRTNDPVLVFEDFTIGGKGEVPDEDEDFTVPLGKADIKRKGTDVTVVSIAGGITASMQAAESLAKDGISVEVLDPRTIIPLDLDAILASVAKTGRLVIVDPAHDFCSVASHISALVAEDGFWDLEAPIKRVVTPHTHIPYNAKLEMTLYPNAARVEQAIRAVLD